MCSEMATSHKKIRLTQNHEILLISEKPKNLSVPVFCTKHVNKEAGLFCIEDECIVCLDCISAAHQGHHFESILDIFEKKKDQIMDEITQAHKVVDGIKAGLDEVKKMTNEEKVRVTAEIDTFFTEVLFCN